ncbi:MAG: VOC family protein [Clostridia bacterium]
MKYSGVCLLVEDMERAKRFYTETLAQHISMDMGQNVTFEGGFSLQSDYERLMGIAQTEVTQQSNSFELYFEEDDLDQVIAKLEAYGNITFRHRKREAPWGQYSLVFYDPDGHLIEVGETMPAMVGRFTKKGLSPAQVSQRTSLPLPAVLEMLKAAP